MKYEKYEKHTIPTKVTILTRKIVEIETQLKILYEQQEMLKQELSMKATLQAQQELTDIQMIIYEKKQVMSQLRTRMETVVDQKVEESLEEKEIDQLIGKIPIIVTESAENSTSVVASSDQTRSNQTAEKVKQTVTIETSKQEFIISLGCPVKNRKFYFWLKLRLWSNSTPNSAKIALVSLLHQNYIKKVSKNPKNPTRTPYCRILLGFKKRQKRM